MSDLVFESPPKSICILRLSAIGDVTHLLPVIATIRQQWPSTKITLIIGKVEYQLIKSLQNIEFIIFDKSTGLKGYIAFAKKMFGKNFDVALLMQVALRANILSLFIKAPIRIGYDKKRSKDLHGLFCNYRIQGEERVHVLDSFFQFPERMGISKRNLNWLIKPSVAARQYAQSIINDKPTVVINPFTSVRANNWRNWPQQFYAQIIDYLIQHNYQVILSGGPDRHEMLFSEEVINNCNQAPINITGKTSLDQLLAILEKTDCLIAPDTGPAHIATIVNTPVVGLFASSNPNRSGPYRSLNFCLNLYPESLLKYNSKSVEEAKWGERVRHPDVMKMISVDSVKTRLNELLQLDSKSTCPH
ncbi:MAG: glycosyltransferase family 9 protein [Bacteroidetes bacterium]|nr:glycosyltransferase family 9 protein [Bacteroidota bacterium]